MKIEALRQTIVPMLQKYGVNRAGLFGSYVKDKNAESRDVDILV